MSDKQNDITGQLFFRETPRNPDGPAGPGRRLMIVVGVLAVPDDMEIKGEHQYVVSGDYLCEGIVRMGLATQSGVIDRTKEAEGLTASGLLSKAIWAC